MIPLIARTCGSGSGVRLLAVFGTPLGIAAVWLASAGELPGPALALLFGVYATGLMWAAMSHALVETQPSEVALVRELPVSGARALVLAAAVSGGCPRAYRPGKTWEVVNGGRLSAPICAPAALALTSAIVGGVRNDATQVACRCPLGAYSVTFAVRAAPA